MLLPGGRSGAAVREHLVRAQRHGRQFPPGGAARRVLLHVVGGQVRFGQEFALPLVHAGAVGGQHQRPLSHEAHGDHADHGLAGAGREDDHAGPAGVAAALVERLRRLALVVAHPQVRRERHGERRARRVPGVVVDGPPGVHQGAFEFPARSGVHGVHHVAHAFAQQRSHGLVAGQFAQQRAVAGRGGQDQRLVEAVQGQAAPAAHQFADVGHDVPRQREFRVSFQRAQHGVGGHAGARGVPQ